MDRIRSVRPLSAVVWNIYFHSAYPKTVQYDYTPFTNTQHKYNIYTYYNIRTDISDLYYYIPRKDGSARYTKAIVRNNNTTQSQSLSTFISNPRFPFRMIWYHCVMSSHENTCVCVRELKSLCYHVRPSYVIVIRTSWRRVVFTSFMSYNMYIDMAVGTRNERGFFRQIFLPLIISPKIVFRTGNKCR